MMNDIKNIKISFLYYYDDKDELIDLIYKT